MRHGGTVPPVPPYLYIYIYTCTSRFIKRHGRHGRHGGTVPPYLYIYIYLQYLYAAFSSFGRIAEARCLRASVPLDSFPASAAFRRHGASVPLDSFPARAFFATLSMNSSNLRDKILPRFGALLISELLSVCVCRP